MEENAHILLIGNDRTQAETLMSFLENNRYGVSVAFNGRDAIMLARQIKPDLIISDTAVPEINGYELCRQLRADDKLKDIPVVLLTSLSDIVDVIQALECEADNFIIKTYATDFLLFNIKLLLLQKKNQSPVTSKNDGKKLKVTIGERTYMIEPNSRRILSFLVTTYESAVLQCRELNRMQLECRKLNKQLEQLIEKRTADLKAEINERRLLETVLQKIHEDLADKQKTAYFGKWEWDILKDEMYWSDEVYRMFGLAPGAIVPTYETFLEFVHPEDRELVKKSIEGGLYEGIPYRINHRIVSPDGSVRTIHKRADVVMNASGKVIQLEGTVLDITEFYQ